MAATNKPLYKRGTVKQAKDLLAHPGGRGDHGFTGGQLKAWKKMREGYLEALTLISLQKRLPAKFSDLNFQCPANEGFKWVLKDPKQNVAASGHRWHTACLAFPQAMLKENHAYSFGTKEGRQWAGKVDGFIISSFSEMDETIRLRNSLAEAEDELVAAKRDVRLAKEAIAKHFNS